MGSLIWILIVIASWRLTSSIRELILKYLSNAFITKYSTYGAKEPRLVN